MSSPEQTFTDKLAAFTHFKVFLNNLSPAYDPPSINLGIEAITTVETAATASMNEHTASHSAYSIAKSARDEAFKTLKTNARAVNELAIALNLESGVLIQIKRITDNILGYTNISNQGMQNQVNNLGELIDLLKSVPAYTPKREFLTVAGLETLHTTLLTTMEDTVQKDLVHKGTIQNRHIAFGDDTGILSKTRQVKHYLRSLWGINSPLYKEVIAITKIIS